MSISQLIPAAAACNQVRAQTHLNHEGAESYFRSLREQVVQVLTTGTLGDTFYVSAEELGKEAMEVLLLARTVCPEFLARALVYARNKGFMRTLPILGLVVLSGGKGKTKRLFESVFGLVILTPDDLRTFAILSRSGKIPGRNGLGGMARNSVREYLSRISEYHAIKYGSSVSREITLGDLVRMSHPRGVSVSTAERLNWLICGKKGLDNNFRLNPAICCLEDLKKATAEEDILRLVRDGGLPFEVVLPSVKSTSPAIWSELLRNAPYMNLLRNLVTFHRHQVFQNQENVELAVRKLTDIAAIERSKVFPFRFYDAWQMYKAVDAPDSRIADAIRTALELSFRNVPSLGNRTIAIGTDVSGSMGCPISENGNGRSFIEIAGVFTGALLRKVEDRVIPLPFEERVHTNCGLSKHDDILVTAEKIAAIGGGGTAVGAPIQYLLDRKIHTDVFIGITDNVDWAYGHGYDYASGNFLNLWRRYRKEVNPEAQAFLVTIAPYRDAVAPSGEKGVHYIYGWSGNVLNYISLSLEHGQGQVQEIEQMKLGALANPNGFQPQNDEDAQTGGGI
jgi:60 kDa SS-A/Ro ribonucleoprotein